MYIPKIRDLKVSSNRPSLICAFNKAEDTKYNMLTRLNSKVLFLNIDIYRIYDLLTRVDTFKDKLVSMGSEK